MFRGKLDSLGQSFVLLPPKTGILRGKKIESVLLRGRLGRKGIYRKDCPGLSRRGYFRGVEIAVSDPGGNPIPAAFGSGASGGPSGAIEHGLARWMNDHVQVFRHDRVAQHEDLVNLDRHIVGVLERVGVPLDLSVVADDGMREPAWIGDDAHGVA